MSSGCFERPKGVWCLNDPLVSVAGESTVFFIFFYSAFNILDKTKDSVKVPHVLNPAKQKT